jgi:hypothetical protein
VKNTKCRLEPSSLCSFLQAVDKFPPYKSLGRFVGNLMTGEDEKVKKVLSSPGTSSLHPNPHSPFPSGAHLERRLFPNLLSIGAPLKENVYVEGGA